MSADPKTDAFFLVAVDDALCSGHGRCYELAPEVYGEDESGYCIVRQQRIPKKLAAAARNGEANCPERAIRVQAV